MVTSIVGVACWSTPPAFLRSYNPWHSLTDNYNWLTVLIQDSCLCVVSCSYMNSYVAVNLNSYPESYSYILASLRHECINSSYNHNYSIYYVYNMLRSNLIHVMFSVVALGSSLVANCDKLINQTLGEWPWMHDNSSIYSIGWELEGTRSHWLGINTAEELASVNNERSIKNIRRSSCLLVWLLPSNIHLVFSAEDIPLGIIQHHQQTDTIYI